MANHQNIPGIDKTFNLALQGVTNGDTAPWLDMFAEDGTMEFPFVPEGCPINKN